MDQLDILEDLKEVAVFDEQSKTLSERIVLKMFQDVRALVKQPTLVHFASFITSYLKKDPSVVTFAVAKVVLSKCNASLQAQALQHLLNALSAECEKMKPEDVAAGYELASNLMQSLVEAGNLQLSCESFKAILRVAASSHQSAVLPTVSQFLQFVVATEFQHKTAEGIETAMALSVNLASAIVETLQEGGIRQQKMVEILGTEEMSKVVPVLFATASGQYLNAGSAGFQLFFELVRIQILHLHGQAIGKLLESLFSQAGTRELLEFPALFGIFRAVLANPLPFQGRLIGKLASDLLKRIPGPEEKLLRIKCGGDAILDLIATPEAPSAFSLCSEAMRGLSYLLQAGGAIADVQHAAFSILSATFRRSDVNLQATGADFGEFLVSLEKFVLDPEKAERLLLSFKAIGDQAGRLEAFTLRPVCKILLQKFDYFQQRSRPIQHVVEHFLERMDLEKAMACFDVSITSNLYVVKLIGKCAGGSKLQSFYQQIVFGAIPQVMAAECPEELKEIMVGQMFETILSVSRQVAYDEYEPGNTPFLLGKYQDLLQQYLGQTLSDPLSLHVLKFFLGLVQKAAEGVKASEPELRHNGEQVARRLSFRFFVQQYVVPRLLPVLVQLVTGEEHQDSPIVGSAAGVILELVKESAGLLKLNSTIQECVSSLELLAPHMGLIIPPQEQFSGAKTLQTAGANVVKRVANFQNQGRAVKQHTLDLLTTLLQAEPLLLGAQTQKVLESILTQLLKNPVYKEVLNKSLKLLGAFAQIDAEAAFRLFELMEDKSLKARATFLQGLKLNTVDAFLRIWGEMRANFLAMNSKARDVSFAAARDLADALVREGRIDEYLGSVVQAASAFNPSTQKVQEIQCILIEATAVLFRVGEVMRDTLTPEFIQELIQARKGLPELAGGFHQLAGLVVSWIPAALNGEAPILRQLLNYLEIYTTNADSGTLADFYEENKEAVFQLFSSVQRLSHIRIQLKRILVALGVCAGRSHLTEYLAAMDARLEQHFGAQEELAQMKFVDRQKCLSQLMQSARNIFSRVNRIVRRVEPDSSFGRYEAAQYLVVHQPIPSVLLGQLKNQSSGADETLELGQIMERLAQKKNDDAEEQELDALVEQAAAELERREDKDEEDVLLDHVKSQQKQRQAALQNEIQDELERLKARRLHKIDARFQRTGKESQNRAGGGDVGEAPSAMLPLLGSKESAKLTRQNRAKLNQGLGIAFGKERKRRDSEVNISKLGKKASRAVHGGRAKVRAVKRKQVAELKDLKRRGRK